MSGGGNEELDAKYSSLSRNRKEVIPISLSAMTVLLGKSTQVMPVGRAGLSPLVIYGKAVEGFILKWTAPGTATVILPVTGEDNIRVGSFTFRMQAAAVMRHVANGQTIYTGLYEDLKGNGLPEQAVVMPAKQVPGKLQAMFGGEGPNWLEELRVSAIVGLSNFSNTNLHQLEGVYGAQIVPGSGELRLVGDVPFNWHASLPVNIEYQ